MRKFKSAMLALSILLSLVVVMGCQPITQTKHSSLVIQMDSVKSLASRSIGTDGTVAAGDIFAFTLSADSTASSLIVGNAALGGKGSYPFYTYGDLGKDAGVSSLNIPTDLTPKFGMAVDLSDGSALVDTTNSAVINSIPMGGSVSGTFTEAILKLKTGSGDVELGPHYISNGTTIYGGGSLSGEKALWFNLDLFSDDNLPVIAFIQKGAGTGVEKGSGFINVNLNPGDVATARSDFVEDITAALGGSLTLEQATYWESFFNTYCVNMNEDGTLSTTLGGVFGRSISLEIIPMTGILDFGDGNTQVTMNLSYSPYGATYSVDETGLTVSGSPPIGFNVSVSAAQ